MSLPWSPALFVDRDGVLIVDDQFADLAPKILAALDGLDGEGNGAPRYVLNTHFHGDHCLGLSGMIMRLALDQGHLPVPIHYPASGEDYFRRLRFATPGQEQVPVDARPATAPAVVHRDDLVVLAPPQESDITSQIAQIEDQMTKGVDGIALAPTDPDALAPRVLAALESGR